MKTIVAVLMGAAALCAAPARPAAAQQPARPFRVIVNAENPVAALEAAEVSRMFLKKTATWRNNGQPVVVIELAQGTVREAFDHDIHGKSNAELERYWQVMVFSGKGTPPPARASDAEVIEIVRHSPYAIAYVSASAPLPADIKTVTITQ